MCFNPRLPGGRRLATFEYYDFDTNVSIHAFRGEGDLYHFRVCELVREFQSTPSGGKATLQHLKSITTVAVSIHAFRGEGDITRVVPL